MVWLRNKNLKLNLGALIQPSKLWQPFELKRFVSNLVKTFCLKSSKNVLTLIFPGSPLLRDGVCQRRRPHVSDPAVRKVQGAGRRVSLLAFIIN